MFLRGLLERHGFLGKVRCFGKTAETKQLEQFILQIGSVGVASIDVHNLLGDEVIGNKIIVCKRPVLFELVWMYARANPVP